MTAEAAPAITPAEIRRQYDAVIDTVPRRTYHGFKPEHLVEQRASGHTLLDLLEAEGVPVRDVVRNTRDEVCVLLGHGEILQRVGTGGYEVMARSASGMSYLVRGAELKDAAAAVRRYVDEAVAQSAAATSAEREEEARRRATVDGRREREDAIVAAYEALPAEMRDGFKAMIAYLALGERRMQRGHPGMGPPIANMLLWQIQGVEGKGLPPFDERRDGGTFHW